MCVSSVHSNFFVHLNTPRFVDCTLVVKAMFRADLSDLSFVLTIFSSVNSLLDEPQEAVPDPAGLRAGKYDAAKVSAILLVLDVRFLLFVLPPKIR